MEQDSRQDGHADRRRYHQPGFHDNGFFVTEHKKAMLFQALSSARQKGTPTEADGPRIFSS
ncbi:hypothetical protein [Mesorhizobium sp. B2-8-9]|uniref:hypothetical protein n=1 Tax=Mesorhizobium sp. B2-8-9 TaxID=2589899 RepID=UPI001129405A|nr:hypothetical protein [Mesorhizobium sp. B2-8-9]TPI72570.1 hypothetical protein FJ423_27305 [Mesorhizobium sp. B2-8-9]